MCKEDATKKKLKTKQNKKQVFLTSFFPRQHAQEHSACEQKLQCYVQIQNGPLISNIFFNNSYRLVEVSGAHNWQKLRVKFL